MNKTTQESMSYCSWGRGSHRHLVVHVVFHPVLVGAIDVIPFVVSGGADRAHEGGLGNKVVGDVEDAQPEVVTPTAQRAADAAAPSPTMALHGERRRRGTRD